MADDEKPSQDDDLAADDMPPRGDDLDSTEEERPTVMTEPVVDDTPVPDKKPDRVPVQTHRVRRWGLIALVLILIVPALIFGAWAWVTLNYSYSKGDRAGYVQKISERAGSAKRGRASSRW